MLGSFHFSVEKGADGRDVLRVTSPQPVTEPFLTFLVEADWARGRLLREYTVLLDPPVFMPEQTDTGRGRGAARRRRAARARRRQDRTSGRARRARRGRASGRPMKPWGSRRSPVANIACSVATRCG